MLASLDAAREYFPPEEMDCVVYHDGCCDGIVSAYAADRFKKNLFFFPIFHEKKYDVMKIPGQNILLVDCAFTQAELAQLKAAGKKVFVLDHHDKNIEALQHLPNVYFEKERSGAGLAWAYFFPNEPVPLFVQMVQERDLWRFKLPGTEAFSAAFWAFLQKFGFDGPFPFRELSFLEDEQAVKQMIADGELLLVQEAAEISEKCKTASLRHFNFEGSIYKVAFIYVEGGKKRSEIGDKLRENNEIDFAAIWYPLPLEEDKIQKYKISFRSKEGGCDVNDIANKVSYDGKGGGHKAAAGTTIIVHPDTLFKVPPVENKMTLQRDGSFSPKTEKNEDGKYLTNH